MWQKICSLPLMACLAVTEFIQDIKNDERGLSGIVVTVLLILVAVLAVIMVWGFLSGWLADLWEQITGKAGDIS